MSFARVRALVVVAALTVAAIIFVVVALVRDSQTGGANAAGCPEGFFRADIRLPEPKEVTVKVFNATGIQGQGERVAEDFRNRNFKVDKKVTDAAKAVEGVAVLKLGLSGCRGTAWKEEWIAARRETAAAGKELAAVDQSHQGQGACVSEWITCR